MTYPKYHAKDLAMLSEEHVWGLDEQSPYIELTFCDDTTHVVDTRSTILAWYTWEFHRMTPGMPILPKHHLLDKTLTSRGLLDIINAGLQDTIDYVNHQVDFDNLTKQAYMVINRIYNVMSYNLEEYVTTIAITDYIDILTHPKIEHINNNIKPTPEGIDQAYHDITHVMVTEPDLMRTSLANVCRWKLNSMGQIHQAIGPRGFLPDTDNGILPSPIMKGFVAGHKKLYESMAESRSSTRSLLGTKKPLQDTEYFNRRMQLVCQYVHTLLPGDCGTTKTVEFYVDRTSLQALDGSYYIADNRLMKITKNSKHLINTYIRKRSPMMCAHRRNGQVCETCFGELSLSIPTRHRFGIPTVLGHMAAIMLCTQISQSVLSAKHEDNSASAEHISLTQSESRFVVVDKHHNIYLHPDYAGKDVKLIIKQVYAPHLSDVSLVKKVSSLTLSQVSACQDVELYITGDKRAMLERINTSVKNRLASLSYDMLEHIKDTGWDIDSYGNYVIPLGKWNHRKPMFKLPMKHLDMLDFMKSITSFLETKSPKSSRRYSMFDAEVNTLRHHHDASEALTHLYKIVSYKAKVNIAYLEIALLGMMIRNENASDYTIPDIHEDESFGLLKTVLGKRSLSGLLAFEEQYNVLTSPETYVIQNRHDHQMDDILKG